MCAAVDSSVITMCIRTDTGKYYYNEAAHRYITVRGVPDLLDKEMVLVPLYIPNHLEIAFYIPN